MSEIVEVLFKGEVRELFVNPGPVILRPGHHVVVQAEKGEDMGKVILKGEWVSKKAEKPPLRQVIRKATAEDLERRDANVEKEIEAFKVCRERIEERELKMKLVDVECRFDGNRITFYFTADKRVDFRELVRDLVQKFRTRLEMRQIGVRHQAKMFGGLGTCGRQLCCGSFLSSFAPVSIRMAKDQNLSLNPAKISGMCGRLMCCLTYEREYYEEAIKDIPKAGKSVVTTKGNGKVVRQNVLKETLTVILDSGEEIEIPYDDILKDET